MDQEIVLQMRGISKSFPGVKALDDARLEVRRGEVHVLLGENGAGKSTLMKVLSGVYLKDEGEIIYEGKPVEIRNIQDARKLGISIIHQELNMLAERNIAQNIYLGREPLKNPYTRQIDEKKMREDSKALLARLGVELSPDTMVKDLSIAQQQMVEVVKALSVETKVLIMDEPTSSLTKREIDALFAIVESLCAQGISVIYISHRMEEIFRIGDRVTVMRDGKYVGTVNVKETNMDQLVTMMVGRQISQMYGRPEHRAGEVALETKDLTGLRFRNVNIRVRCGEIVGIGGLVGAGRTELVKAIFGYDRIESGKVFVHGREMKRHSPRNSVEAGIGFLPEDRKSEGLIQQQPIKNNILQASMKRYFKRGLVDKKAEKELAERYRGELKIATPDVTRRVSALSGGNQQKVVIAKWLCTENRILIFDEPTRGIDVGAKAEIYALIGRLAGEGYAILVVSSDQMELIGISDRVYVMKDGEVVGELGREEITAENIVSYAVGKEET